MNTADAKRVLETALICSHQPIHPRELRVLFDDALGLDTIKTLLEELQHEWTQRASNWCKLLRVGAFKAAQRCVNISTD